MQTFKSMAHGRVNLIGEHTDYNGGWVLPTAIPQSTRAELTRTGGLDVRLASSRDPKLKSAREETFRLGEEKKRGDWTDYIQGITSILRTDGMKLEGFSIRIDSDVPEGSGLSSSAALEISVLKALREAFRLPLKDTDLARIGQRVENEFVGARVGIMDQMACSLAKRGEALFLDTKELTFENVTLPLDRVDLVVIYSGVSHRLVGSGYNQRRSECEGACAKLGISLLREIPFAELSRVNELPDVLRRRARHVITENQRVFDAVKAIRGGDPERLGELFKASHASMRDDYEVSIPEIDRLVELLAAQSETYGARLTGGGFGGSVIAITKKGTAPKVLNSVLPEYHRATGETAKVLVGAEA